MDEENTYPKFKSLADKLSKTTLKAIKNMGFKHMTAVQAEVLPKALDGRDVVATAKTGSGKTLAFLIPVVESISKQIIDNYIQGTLCIVISPTRELAIQTYTVLQDLLTHHSSITSSLVIGGESRRKQSAELSTGVHIVVATPGRLFDHMRTKEFYYSHVNCLVLDEADKIFQYGFEEDLKQIIGRLPKKRQTMLFSATEAETTQALIKSAMKDDVEAINMSEDNLRATVEGLKQGYAICETEHRLYWLHKLLKKTANFKVMVFFSSCKSVIFHHEFFSKYCQASVLCIHGKMNQADRTATITSFYNAEKVALFCTDLAARGLDIPAVDWIVQFDPPADTNEYIHRVGRTARGLGAAGNAVLLLRPEEKEFVDYLHEAKIYLDKFESWDRYYNLQPKALLRGTTSSNNMFITGLLTSLKSKYARHVSNRSRFFIRSDDQSRRQLIDHCGLRDFNDLDEAFSNPDFHKLAVDAMEGYIRSFEVRKLKHVFNLLTLDLNAAARSFGLKEKPEVDIHVGFNKKHRPRKRKAAMLAAQPVQSSKLLKS